MRPTQSSPDSRAPASVAAMLALALAACAGSTPDGKPPPFVSTAVVDARVLTGPEGVRVRLVQTDGAALVELDRVREDLDGAVLLAELGGSTAARSYHTKIDGRTARLLGRKNRDWTLYIGGPIRLEVDQAASEALDPGELIDRHVRQRAAGRLAALARFDVEGARSEAESGLAESMARLQDSCGFAPETEIDFSGLTEEQMKRFSLASYCDAPRGAFQRACKVPELKPFVAEVAKRYTCRFGDALALDVDEGGTTFTVHFDTPNQSQWAREAFDAVDLGEGRSVRKARVDAATVVCRLPDSDRAVVVGPSEDEATAGVAYGPPERLLRQPERRFLPEGWFFEPRYPNPQHNDSFRGYDLRVFSYVETDDDEDLCKLHCGTREIALTPLRGEDKRAFLAKADWSPLPDPREPYALARDKRGRYYYVDRGATSQTEKDFRLYVGPQGRLRRQRMKDIVSDSEGEIFASVGGRLKLFLGKEEAEWQARGRTRKLVRVDVTENLPLIYGALGVYLGRPLHNPCDDL